jgi:hypothetical protein
MENVGQIKFQATDFKTGQTNTTLKSQGTDVSDFLLAGIDVVECEGNWLVLNNKGGYVWNERTGKRIDIDRKGRRFEIELFVPENQQAQDPRTEMRPWKKTMKPKECCPGHGRAATNNKFEALSKQEGEWNLGFLGQAKP